MTILKQYITTGGTKANHERRLTSSSEPEIKHTTSLADM